MSNIIETERLFLREFTTNDSLSFYTLNSDLLVQKYTGDEIVSSIDRAKEIILKVTLADYENYGFGRWAAVFKPENKVIGFAGLKFLPEVQETDIGFRFMPEYWGKGLATEASKAIIKYGFEHLKLKKILGIAMPENVSSCKVLEKLGLKHYKTDGYMGDSGEYFWYCISNKEYFDEIHNA